MAEDSAFLSVAMEQHAIFHSMITDQTAEQQEQQQRQQAIQQRNEVVVETQNPQTVTAAVDKSPNVLTGNSHCCSNCCTCGAVLFTPQEQEQQQQQQQQSHHQQPQQQLTGDHGNQDCDIWNSWFASGYESPLLGDIVDSNDEEEDQEDDYFRTDFF